MSVIHDPTLNAPVAPGEIVADKYRVERVLGVGGMGVVVSARHVTLDQVVAIKFLVGDRFGTSREELVERFLAEARAAARIDSDHVCRVFDVGVTELGVPFMVMEHLEGNDLHAELERRGQIGVTEAVDYILQAAEAMAAAHAIGIVHRDIKPSNLFLDVRPDGSCRVKVLDFGISRASDSGAQPEQASSLGTPAYMSPEQVRAVPDVDGRTDIWALGAILYELLTGQMAFVGETVHAILDMVLHDDPCPMSTLRANLPPELERIVARCLERDRDRRWPTAATLARALAPYGSVGIVTQLTSVQRELGSIGSIKTVAAQSVEPMVASVRRRIDTEPDPSELRARESLVNDWSKLRARRRTARIAVLGVSVASCLAATLGVVMALRARAHRAHGDGTFDDGSSRAPARAAELPAPALDPPPASPSVPWTDARAPSSNVQDAPNSMQSTLIAPARPPVPRSAVAPGRSGANAKGGSGSRPAGPSD